MAPFARRTANSLSDDASVGIRRLDLLVLGIGLALWGRSRALRQLLDQAGLARVLPRMPGGAWLPSLARRD
jgi:hypothetical protein